MVSGVCRLCEQAAELKDSHIVPKFVFDWMKRTGTPYFRVSGRPNKREQDGRKYHLLCGECEQRFSLREGWFSENIYIPYLERAVTSFRYDPSLYYFLLSVLWRALQDGLPRLPGDHPYLQRLLLAEYEWRAYLMGGPVPPTCRDVHLFLADIGTTGESQPVVNFSRYFARTVDHTIGWSGKHCFVYVNFTRFLVFGNVGGLDPALLVGTGVLPAGSTLTLPQQMLDPSVGEFLIDRARTAHSMVAKGTSPKQKQVIADAFRRDAPRILNSDLGAALAADFHAWVDPSPVWPAPGDEEDCTCGSGKPFKECHGR